MIYRVKQDTKDVQEQLPLYTPPRASWLIFKPERTKLGSADFWFTCEKVNREWEEWAEALFCFSPQPPVWQPAHVMFPAHSGHQQFITCILGKSEVGRQLGLTRHHSGPQLLVQSLGQCSSCFTPLPLHPTSCFGVIREQVAKQADDKWKMCFWILPLWYSCVSFTLNSPVLQELLFPNYREDQPNKEQQELMHRGKSR